MRRIYTLVAMALLAATIAACGGSGGDESSTGSTGGGASADKEVTVGVVLKNLSSPFWAQVRRGIEESIPGVKVELSAATSEVDVAGQIAQIENAVTKGVDALVVAPTVPDQLLPALQRAADQGLPIVLVDTDIPRFADKTAYVGTDNLTAGRLAGDYINEQLRGRGELGMLVSAPGVTSVDDREKGMKGQLDAGIKVLNGGVTECVRDKGVTSAEDLLTAHPEVNAIFTSCADPMKGALRAIAAAGKSGDILAVGFDLDAESAQEVRSGQLAALVTQFPVRMGALAVRAAADAARGEDVESVIDSGAELVTKDNVEDIAGAAGF
ncbi:MAG TPA: sugar ABC transporter substrate-binding protein [Conexibacter sp.]